MDAPRPFGTILLLTFLAGLVGCAGAPRPAPAASPQAASPAPAGAETPAPPPTPPPTPSPTPPPEAASPQDDKVIVVDPGGTGDAVSLVEAARAERERKAHAAPPVAVITDKTLPKYATGQVTFAKPTSKTPPKPLEPGDPQNEQYWRDRGLEIRTRWHDATQEVKDLEQQAADWRKRFYDEDDPYFRDGQIKPEWDRVLDRLQQKRTEVEEAKRDLAQFLEEGRRAGALPGWLREGTELEPEEAPKEPSSPEPVEPPVMKENIPPPSV